MEGQSLRVRSIIHSDAEGKLADNNQSEIMQCWQFRSIDFHWSDQLDLDFILCHLQPLFGSRGAALKTFDVGFQLADPLLGGSQLKRNLVRHGHRALDVLLRDIRCVFDQSKQGLPKREAAVVTPLGRRRQPHQSRPCQPRHGAAGLVDGRGSEFGRKVAVDFETDANFDQSRGCPSHYRFPPIEQ
jgi:hypothetical protein